MNRYRVTQCLVCGEKTKKPLLATLWHFRLVHWGQWRYWRGNIAMFGFWSGLKASICLSFPFINTLVHWKYRGCSIAIHAALASTEPAK